MELKSAAASAFAARISHWTAAGLTGAAVYEALANDDELPTFFEPADLAAIESVKPSAIKRRRNRGSGPPYVLVSARTVRYPRTEYCRHLAARYGRRTA